MVKPSLAQHRLGGPPTEVPIPFDPPHSSATCFGTLFFKPVFKPIQNSQALCECFWHTGNWSNSSTIMQLKNKSELLSECSFQISRMSNQKRVHVCHDRLWFSGDVCILVIIIHRPQQLEKGFLSSLGHNPSQPPVTVSSLATAPSSPCISLGILLSDGVQCLPCPDYEILGMRSLRSLRVFQLSFAHALTPWGEPRGGLPEAEARRRCIGRQSTAATRWSRCC